MKRKIIFKTQAEEYKDRANDIAESLQYDIVDFAEKLNITIESVQQLKEFTPDHLQKFLDEQKQALVGASQFVPSAIRKQFDEQFNRTYNDALPLVVGTQKRLKELSAMKLKPTIKDGKVALNTKEVEERATDFATYEFSDTQCDYYELISAAVKALKQVADFETKNKLPHIADLDNKVKLQGGEFNEFVFFNLIHS